MPHPKGLHLKDMPGFIQSGVNKIMRGYEQIKRDVGSPNIIGAAAKRMGDAAFTHPRSGAPLPGKYQPK